MPRSASTPEQLNTFINKAAKPSHTATPEQGTSQCQIPDRGELFWHCSKRALYIGACTASPDANGTARLPVSSPQGKWSHCYAGASSPSLPVAVVRTPLHLSACSHALHQHNPREHRLASHGSCVQLTDLHLMAGVLHMTGEHYWERHLPSSEGRCIFHSLGQLLQCKWLPPC